MNTKQISVSEFKAHCAEELRGVETEAQSLEITRHGKVIAVVEKPHAADDTLPVDWSDYLGGLRGTVSYAPDYDPAESAWSAAEWDMNQTDNA